MYNEIDLTYEKRNFFKNYNGANGNKICIIYNDENYLLKFSPKAKNNKLMSYTNSCFSEYISCRIIESLGLNVQKTYLGKYKEKIVVVCKDFETKNKRFFDFASLKNSIIDSETGGYSTELIDILNTIENQEIIDKTKLKTFFWDMFIVDSLLGNFDRHNGNWGFLVNFDTNKIEIAPIFDCGSCLFPQLNEMMMKNILESKDELENRIYVFPNSIIKEDNVKINYYNFLTTTKDLTCLKSLLKIYNRIDSTKIKNIIKNTPYINDIHKIFLEKIINLRKEKILQKAIEINKNIKKIKDMDLTL